MQGHRAAVPSGPFFGHVFLLEGFTQLFAFGFLPLKIN